MSKWDAYGEEAEQLFVEKGLSLTEIARILPVSVQTLVKWKKAKGWDKKRARFLAQPVTITDKLRELLELRLNRMFEKMDRGEEVTDAEIDGITKLISSIKKVEREVDLTATAPMLMKEFSMYLIEKSKEDERYKELKDEFVEILPGFMDYIWKRYRRG